MARSNDYWERRARRRMAHYHREAEQTVRQIAAAYDKAQADIQTEIDKIFRTFSTNGQMDHGKARRVLNQRIPNPLLSLAKRVFPRVSNERVRRWLLNRMNAPAYRARITRLQALKEQVYLQSKLLADAEISLSSARYVKTIDEAYYRTMFDLQQGAGYAFEFAAMPARTVETILKRPWSGEHFSNRVWRNTGMLAEHLNEVITAGFESGANVKQMRDELSERMGVGKFAANRLVRTETTYMANAAEMEAYGEADIERYRFVATLDLRTSEECRQHDGKVYAVKDAKPGVNLPALHAFCRSTTIAVIGDDDLEGLQRRARNPLTGKNELVPANMSYKDWREGLDGKHDIAEIQIRNRAADQNQFERYRAVLGKDAPKSFAAFQELKYTEGEGWKQLRGQYRKLNAYERIAANESQITADLKGISKTTGVEMVGLEYRLKTKASYLRKVNADSKNSTNAKIISDTIAGTNDVIRYTYQANGESLVDAFAAVTGQMAAMGYSRYKLKNTWNDKRNPYKGINAIFESPNGQRFEVQFHTPESFELKNGPLHKLYEEYRMDSTPPERRAQLTLEMFQMSSMLVKPRDIDSIK